MTWQLLLAIAVTAPAILVTLITIPYFLWRRHAHRREIIRRAKEGPRHIDSPYCKCRCCDWEKEFQEIERDYAEIETSAK